MFKALNKRVSFPISYVSLTVLLACIFPLMLPKLPAIKTLAMISVFLGVPALIFRWKCFGYPLIFCITIAHFVFQANTYERQRFKETHVNRTIKVTVKIIDFPKIYQNKYSIGSTATFTVKLLQDSLLTDGRKLLYKGSILKLSCYRCGTEFSLGETWELIVKLKPPKGSASWGAFDYEKYAFANEVIATGYVRQNQATLLNDDQSMVDAIRRTIQQYIKDALLQPLRGQPDINGSEVNAPKLSRALLLALTIGDRSELDSNKWQVFQSTGTSHLMAISGLHITLIFLMVASGVRMMLKCLGIVLPTSWNRWLMERVFCRISVQALGMILGLVLAIMYALVSGFSLPTQRAVLMLGVVCISQLFFKKVSLLTALCLAVTVLLSLSPLSTLHIGFWLSVLAILMIVILLKTRELSWLMQCRLALAMIPVSVLLFNNVPMVSPIANIVAIPVIGIVVLPVTFLLVFFGILFSMLFAIFSHSIAIKGAIKGIELMWGLLDALLNRLWTFLEWLAVLQMNVMALFPDIAPDFEMMGAITALMVFIILTWRLLMARALVVSAMCFLLLIRQSSGLNDYEYIVTVLDVGQGLAIIIETSESYTVFDTGIGFANSDSAERIILPYLNHHERKPIDRIIVSHGDNDHIGGLKTLHKRYPEAPVLINEVDHLPIQLDAQSCHEKQWRQSGVKFTIFSNLNAMIDQNQTDQLSYYRGNNASCVMMVSSPYGSILLPADIERPAEHALIQYFAGQLKADVLIAAHHGSRSSSTPAFLNQVQPAISIISAAYFSPYGHPHKDVMKRLRKSSRKVLSTARSGSIKIDFLKDGIQTREYRALHPRFWYSEP